MGKIYLDYSFKDNYYLSNNKNDYIDTTIWIREQWLCNEINSRFPVEIKPEDTYHIRNMNLAKEVYKYFQSISKEKHLLGTSGCHYC